jgi:hypothetical protein
MGRYNFYDESPNDLDFTDEDPFASWMKVLVQAPLTCLRLIITISITIQRSYRYMLALYDGW